MTEGVNRKDCGSGVMNVENGWLIVLAHPVSSIHPISLVVRGVVNSILYNGVKPIYISPMWYEVPHYQGVYGCVVVFRVDHSPSD